jgi:hypothetical protein
MVEEIKKTSPNQVTEQKEDPSNPIFRRWHQIGFCERARAMREYNLGKGQASPKFTYNVDPQSVR